MCEENELYACRWVLITTRLTLGSERRSNTLIRPNDTSKRARQRRNEGRLKRSGAVWSFPSEFEGSLELESTQERLSTHFSEQLSFTRPRREARRSRQRQARSRTGATRASSTGRLGFDRIARIALSPRTALQQPLQPLQALSYLP